MEQTLEGRMGLELNREKTRRVDMKAPGESLDFLGYTFSYYRDLKGRDFKYLNVAPSKKAIVREQAVLRQKTSSRYCYMPLPTLIEGLNRHLRGWGNYFSYGYPRVAKRQINRFVRERLVRHLRRRSQRPYRPPEGVSYYKHFSDLGLEYL
jgi:RNA-directed DNA polymerase